MSSKKLSKIKEFDIWDNDGIVSPPTKEDMEGKIKPKTIEGVTRQYIMQRKKHKYYEGNIKLKQDYERQLRGVSVEKSDNESDNESENENAQEYWTQKTGLHFRTCPVCASKGIYTYVKGRCYRCGSLPGQSHPELYEQKDYSVKRNVEGAYYSRDKGVESNIGGRQKCPKCGSSNIELGSNGIICRDCKYGKTHYFRGKNKLFVGAGVLKYYERKHGHKWWEM